MRVPSLDWLSTEVGSEFPVIGVVQAGSLWVGYFRDGFCPGGWSELYDLGALSSLDAMILK